MKLVKSRARATKPPAVAEAALETPIVALVYCPMCTHTVHGNVEKRRSVSGKTTTAVVVGQKCPRCNSPLDAGVVMRLAQAA